VPCRAAGAESERKLCSAANRALSADDSQRVSVQVDLLTAALELVHKDDLDAALGVLRKAAASAPESLEVAMHLGFVLCSLGQQVCTQEQYGWS
jgi:Flp pilus assembly protein TadD